MGPVLFFLFVNTLELEVKKKVGVVFADDTKLFRVAKTKPIR